MCLKCRNHLKKKKKKKMGDTSLKKTKDKHICGAFTKKILARTVYSVFKILKEKVNNKYANLILPFAHSCSNSYFLKRTVKSASAGNRTRVSSLKEGINAATIQLMLLRISVKIKIYKIRPSFS